MRKEEQSGLVIEALTMLRAMQERLTPHEEFLNIASELPEAISRLEIFLARGDRFAEGWWTEFRLILDMVLTVLRLYLDFLR